jgi:hypothetical protein
MTLARPMFPPVDPTRRRFLTQAAGVAAGGTVLALATVSPALGKAAPASPLVDLTAEFRSDADPIFAAIESHKAARAAVNSAVGEVAAMEKQLGGVGRFERKGNNQLEAIEAALEISFNAETEAACELVSTSAPTTIAGVVALLQYATAADTDGEGWPADLQSDDDHRRSRSWHYFLIEMLADVLPDLAVQS